MTFWQQFAILFFSSLIVPLILMWAGKKMKEAEAVSPKRRLTNREIRDEHGDMCDAFRRIYSGIEDYERFCQNGQDESAAATIAAMKRDIRPEWKQI